MKTILRAIKGAKNNIAHLHRARYSFHILEKCIEMLENGHDIHDEYPSISPAEQGYITRGG